MSLPRFLAAIGGPSGLGIDRDSGPALRSVVSKFGETLARDLCGAGPRFRGPIQDLFAGTQSYAGLKVRLPHNLNGTLHEIIMTFFFHRPIPGENRV